eukprot:gene14627-5710_t
MADSSWRGPQELARKNDRAAVSGNFNSKHGTNMYAFQRTKEYDRGYYDPHTMASSAVSALKSSSGIRGGFPGQMTDSPASDVSVIPWVRSLPSSCSEIDSRAQSVIKTEGEASSSVNNNNNVGTTVDLERRKSAIKAEPIRPIPQMVPAEFLRRGMYSEVSRPPSTAHSLRSTVLDFGSRNSSSFSSPRHSAVRRGQKRGLSVSPLSAECIDLNAIIRTSPNSLVAFITGSRGSSAASRASRASGSYGHLSAASISPSPFCTPVPNFYGRQRNPFSTPSLPRTPSASLSHKNSSEKLVSSSIPRAGQFAYKPLAEVKKEEVSPCAAVRTEEADTFQEGCSKTPHFSEEEDDESTNDFRCHWKDCGNIYDGQTALVAHVNNDHIQKSKKDCTCYWKGCAREEKPFKAMYMLVVHVRRHTGEKPHACDFPGCTKAYSRLENLKTHRRSHTGERPYACEFEGCTKAFSNASDRAKHQNRTHSSIKQYGCKVEGCPKRYTDPSSLRKHMKTVHGAIAQPNKKMKGEKSESKKEKIERKEKEEQEQRRKSVGECLTVKPLQQKTQGNNDRSSYGAGGHRGSMSSYAHSPLLPYSQGRMPPNDSFNTYRAWGVQQASPSSTTTECETAEQSPMSNHSNAEPYSPRGPGIQVQTQPRAFLPRLSGKPRASEGLLHEVSRRLSDSRRLSNTSLISVDSGAESMISSHNGSRRGSDISLQSYLSSRRSSLSSPMPPSRLSPRSIANQTLIEGKVFESASPGSNSLIEQSFVEHQDVAHSQHNRQSRVSSGYGSQTAYFHCKSPAVQQIPSPVPPAKGRRASEGNVTRVGDTMFEPANVQQASRGKNRRGSEPISPVNLLEQAPRRNSMSTYNPLPVPDSMRHSLNFQNEDMARSPNTIQRDQMQTMQNPYIQPNLFVQRDAALEVEPQFPPPEEELARGSLFASTNDHHSSTVLQAADSTVPDPARLPISTICQESYYAPVSTNKNQWQTASRNIHPSTVVAEADSSADWIRSQGNTLPTENYEDAIVREIRCLSTGMATPQPDPYQGASNMAINYMNTLLSSLDEENKFFETNRMAHHGFGGFL